MDDTKRWRERNGLQLTTLRGGGRRNILSTPSVSEKIIREGEKNKKTIASCQKRGKNVTQGKGNQGEK